MNIGLDRMEVKAIFRKNFVGRIEETALMDCITNAVGEVVEENNKKLWKSRFSSHTGQKRDDSGLHPEKQGWNRELRYL